VESIPDPRIRLVQDGVNKGISYRLNQSLDLARGYYFARMDADDIAFPERIARQVKFMEDHLDIDLVATGVLVFGNAGDVKGVIQVKHNHNAICSRPWNGFHMPHPTWLGRIEWFRFNHYRSSADKAEDQDLLFRTYLTSHFACIPDVLLGYRQDTRSLSKMIAARRVFAKSFIETAIRRRQFLKVICLTLNITIKMIADILNIVCGIKFLRNKLDAIPQDTLGLWQEIWHATNYARLPVFSKTPE
jgi:glycosyltransferase involved in cell wall biosynthesis